MKIFIEGHRLVCKLPSEILINKDDPYDTVKIWLEGDGHTIELEELKEYAGLARQYADEIEKLIDRNK